MQEIISVQWPPQPPDLLSLYPHISEHATAQVNKMNRWQTGLMLFE